MNCTNPLTIKRKGENIKVPCNYCLACRINKTTQWLFRLSIELPKFEGKSLFASITYDELNLPYIKLINNQVISTLKAKDIIDFHKRLRKEGLNFKYYVAGEYGEETDRPHYHGIYLGLTHGDEYKLLEKWNKGNIHFGSTTTASMRYTLGYILNKNKEEIYLPREAPKALISNGIGLEYFTWGLTLEDIQKAFNEGYILTGEGKKIAIPKYIKDRYEELNKGHLYSRLKSIKNNKIESFSDYIKAKQEELSKQEQIKLKLEHKKYNMSRNKI